MQRKNSCHAAHEDADERLNAATGIISGSPSVAGTFTLSLTATNIAGTSPVNRAEFLRITSLNYLPGNNAGTLRWTSVENRSYRVEQSTDLLSWQLLAAPVYAIDGAVTASWSVPKNGPQRFFRVIALKPPAGE